MELIGDVIELFFSRYPREKTIQSAFGAPHFKADIYTDEKWFCKMLESGSTRYSQDEAANLYQTLQSLWIYPPDKKDIPAFPRSERNTGSIFNLLLHFSTPLLLEENEIPVCEYNFLPQWRKLSMILGEDLFTTSFLASKDIVSQRTRNFFSWTPAITNNNRYLQEIFNKGLTELHFHLKGSSQNFILNWLSLMNSITNRQKKFQLLAMNKKPDIFLHFSDRSSESLYAECVKACTIRMLLFIALQDSNTGQEISNFFPNFRQILESNYEKETLFQVHHLQHALNLLKYWYGKKYGKTVVDYAIPTQLTERDIPDKGPFSSSIFYGERWIMYHMFRNIYARNSKVEQLSTLFYAYLLIKQRIRSEFIQTNGRVGFANFADYESRKTLFIRTGSIYDTLIANVAVNTTLSNQHIHYLEARVTPRDSKKALTRTINQLEKDIYDKRFYHSAGEQFCHFCPKNKIPCLVTPQKETASPRHHYILHFIKEREKRYHNDTDIYEPRHAHLRKKIKQQTLALNALRKSILPIKRRIVGVDAANTEIGCRPEIFGQAFRFLKEYSYRNPFEYISGNSFSPLGFTFHAGEDFMDIADGLRAIDETVMFLNFKRGDRLGHALALGINPLNYYKLKKNTLTMPQQDFLDNVAWLLFKSKNCNILIPPCLESQLKRWFTEYFYKIYDNYFPDTITPDLYYSSMLLRGDAPDMYRFDPISSHIVCNTSYTNFWEKCGKNEFSDAIVTARQLKQARQLYYLYQYEPSVKIKGQISGQYHIDDNYITLIAELQKSLREDLAQQHICIETNPTSNYHIGTYKSYLQHPITTFFNIGLTHNQDELRNCPQLSVSLNTDDQGVFATCLENEYALMSIALEQCFNQDGTLRYNPRMLHNWLDNIRLMGFEQRFLKN